MTLDSDSSDVEVREAIDDNAGYDLPGGGVAMCAEYIKACRIRINRMSAQVDKGDASIREDYARLQKALDSASDWYRANDTTSTSGRGDCRQIGVRTGRW